MVAGLPPATAQNSLQHSGQALTHSLNAVGHSFIGGAQLVSGVVSVSMPIIFPLLPIQWF